MGDSVRIFSAAEFDVDGRAVFHFEMKRDITYLIDVGNSPVFFIGRQDMIYPGASVFITIEKDCIVFEGATWNSSRK